MNFCPHCHSGNDSVLKDTTWSCGVRFNDALWRTKECYKRQIHVGDEHLRLQEQHISELEEENGRLKQRIQRLEDCAETAWGIIANVDSGSWQEQRADWREAATRWRDKQFHPELSERKAKEAKP